MTRLYLAVAFCLTVSFPEAAAAFTPIVQTPEGPYTQIEVDELPPQAAWLGALVGFPDLYQFSLAEPMTLSLQLSQAAAPTLHEFQILVVRENDDGRGVTEVGRQQVLVEYWEARTALTFGLARRSAPVYSLDLDPGVYRLEVSTPTNVGAYQLDVLAGAPSWSWLGPIDILTVLNHFDRSPLRIVLSAYTLIPLLLVGTGVVFIRRRQLTTYA